MMAQTPSGHVKLRTHTVIQYMCHTTKNWAIFLRVYRIIIMQFKCVCWARCSTTYNTVFIRGGGLKSQNETEIERISILAIYRVLPSIQFHIHCPHFVNG